MKRLREFLQKAFDVTKKTYQVWKEDQASLHSAALAYYMIFSLAPILLILISVLSLWIDQENARDLLLDRLYTLVGVREGLNLIDLIDSLRRPEAPWFVSLIEGGVIIFGASNLFSHLRRSLNRIWNIAPAPENHLWLMVRKRLAGLLILLGMGLLVLISIIFSTLFTALRENMFVNVPFWLAIVNLTNEAVGFLALWALFAIMFKVLPDAEIAWKDVWVGAGVTTLLFYIGQMAIDMYLQLVKLGSGYGAASSLIVFLVWIYYIAQTFYFGAEFVEVYANQYGGTLRPAKHAGWLDQDFRSEV